MTKKIVTSKQDDIKEINRICSQYTFDIGLHSKSGIADAKSLLGLFLLSLNEDKFLVVDDNVDARNLFKELSKYIVDEDEE